MPCGRDRPTFDQGPPSVPKIPCAMATAASPMWSRLRPVNAAIGAASVPTLQPPAGERRETPTLSSIRMASFDYFLTFIGGAT